MRLIIPILITLALAVPASANDCVPTTSEPEVEVAGFYLDNDACQLPPDGSVEPDNVRDWLDGGGYGDGDDGDGPCLFSIWWYQEANGIPGLQRGDEVVDDTCNGMIESDTLAFF